MLSIPPVGYTWAQDVAALSVMGPPRKTANTNSLCRLKLNEWKKIE